MLTSSSRPNRHSIKFLARHYDDFCSGICRWNIVVSARERESSYFQPSSLNGDKDNPAARPQRHLTLFDGELLVGNIKNSAFSGKRALSLGRQSACLVKNLICTNKPIIFVRQAKQGEVSGRQRTQYWQSPCRLLAGLGLVVRRSKKSGREQHASRSVGKIHADAGQLVILIGNHLFAPLPPP